MKKLLIAVSFMVAASAAQAQAKPGVPVKAVDTLLVQLPTVQCEMCKSKIETYLNRYDGILTANVNPKGKWARVKFVTDRVNKEEIKAAISNAGYEVRYYAEVIEAEPGAYKRLPLCCKRPEDGGGMKKN